MTNRSTENLSPVEENASADKLPRGASLEEMIALLNVTRREWSAYVNGFNPKEHEKFDQIIAALRAGHKCFQETCVFAAQRAIHDGTPLAPTEGMKAWLSATTKGEKE